ncbi:hypothetical protein GCM10027515_32990 [Schumannella luteola]|uniref:Flagellar protein FlgN n=1 Tax=Schumannella luteola TaxID=472059 RepID=A0A852YCJ5_9MICO|nr:hypothetical protein [Schumannella luteola]NYG98901.1 hypothetical protein [Schumannella luteola]
MPDLKMDLGLLEQLRNDLDAVIAEFEGADDFSDDVAEATGHDDLGGHVRDFAHKWNDKRKKMTENIKALREQLSAITDGFTKVDKELAKALRDAADSGDTSFPPPGQNNPGHNPTAY